ncbi:MAG TPA: hypothetical protein VH165_04330 [Kofleriaceae bacterium]|nr:hypothetical protein [Kofleriaceae bacterium]
MVIRRRPYYVDNVASNLRVTPKMFGRLHRSLIWATKILDVPEPELYVTVVPHAPVRPAARQGAQHLERRWLRGADGPPRLAAVTEPRTNTG